MFPEMSVPVRVINIDLSYQSSFKSRFGLVDEPNNVSDATVEVLCGQFEP
jgi:hypothetical protein